MESAGALADHFRYEPQRTTHTDALSRRALYEYDENGDLVAVVNALGQRQATPFDERGNPAGLVDALGRTTRYTHDARGNLSSVTDAAGASTRIRYNALDLPVSITDAMSQVWRMDYDERGNLLQQTDPLQQTSRYHYDGRGLPLEHVDARGGRKRMSWNAAGQLVVYTDCSGRSTRFGYDVLGVQVSRQDAAGHLTQAQTDALGRVTQLLEPALQGQAPGQHRFAYDGEGNLLAYADPLGAVTRYAYDGAGQPLLRQDAQGGELRYEYDAARRLTALVNENGASYRFCYDDADKLTDEIGFDGRHQRYVYDEAGNLSHLIERGGSDLGPGKLTWFERDATGRLRAKRHSQDEGNRHGSRFEYDKLGRLLQADNAAAQVRFAYDPLGRLLRETQSLLQQEDGTQGGQPVAEFAFEHGYDELGNRISTTLPSARRVHWLRYGSGHLHQINIASRRDGKWVYRVVSDIERDALHREVQRSQGAVASRYEHDPMGRLLAQRVVRSETLAGERTTLGLRQGPHAIGGLRRQYRYDAAGNLQSTLDSLRGEAHYAYDRLGRVLSGIKAGQAEHFAFDPAGNLLQQAGAALPDNRVHVFEDLRLEYDEHGNVIRRRKGWHTEQQFSYGPEHQLRQATVQRSTNRQDPSAVVSQTTHYRYDALGRRVAKADAFGCTHFAYDGDLLSLEQRGARRAEYLYEDASFVPLARIESLAGEEDYALQYYHCDQIGAPQELSDEQGRIVWAANYKVWGEVQPVAALATGTDGGRYTERTALRSVAASVGSQQERSLGVVEQPLRFQGQYFDAETGLHYNRFRYYDPAVGRFTSQDPIGLWGGRNLYESATPINWFDPVGLSPCRCSDPCAIASHANQPSPRPAGQQSHHIIQDAWAQANIPGYDRGTAPTILLQKSPSHSSVTVLQNARRDSRLAAGEPKWGTDLKDEFNNAYRDLGTAGVNEKCRRKAIKRAYRYFTGVEMADIRSCINALQGMWYHRPEADSTIIYKIEAQLNLSFPDDFKAFVLWSNGGEGKFPKVHISLWEVEHIPSLNQDYQIQHYLGPHLIGIGSDGGPICFLLDYRDENRIGLASINFGDLDPSEIKIVAPSFTAFIEMALSGALNDNDL